MALAAACSALFLFQPLNAMAQQQSAPSAGAATATAPLYTPADAAQMQGVKDYLDTSSETVEVSQLGILVRDGNATLDDGEKIAGVMVVDVAAKGAAAAALGSHEASHMLLGGVLLAAGVASAVLFPPALIGVMLLANSHIGMSSDLVIGVDGRRVRNTMELMQYVGEAHSGDTVYLAIVRHGRRCQIPVHLQ